MKSATRSGRIYSLNEVKNQCFFTSSKQETTPQKRIKKVNVITPDLDQDKTTKIILYSESPVRNDIDNQVFYSIDESEEKHEPLKPSLFLGKVSPFDYSSNDSDSPTIVPLLKENYNELSSQHKQYLPSPRSKRAHERMDTIPIHPMVPRNYYGGIRDCLPPIGIQGTPNVNNLPRRELTVQQLERIEANRLITLSKLRASR